MNATADATTDATADAATNFRPIKIEAGVYLYRDHYLCAEEFDGPEGGSP